MANTLRSRDRIRAEYAYDDVKIANTKDIDFKIYSSYLKTVPMLILTNGLLPTLAYIADKGKKKVEYKEILNSIIKYIECEDIIEGLDKKDRNEKLNYVYERLGKIQQNEYRRITKEILAYLVWMKRFSSGMGIKETEGEGKNE